MPRGVYKRKSKHKPRRSRTTKDLLKQYQRNIEFYKHRIRLIKLIEKVLAHG